MSAEYRMTETCGESFEQCIMPAFIEGLREACLVSGTDIDTVHVDDAKRCEGACIFNEQQVAIDAINRLFGRPVRSEVDTHEQPGGADGVDAAN